MCGLSVWVDSAVPGAAVPGWATVGRVRGFEQYPHDRLKTDCSRTPVPIPPSLTLVLSAHVKQFSTEWLMTDEGGVQMGPWQLQRAFRPAERPSTIYRRGSGSTT
jgi:hypothetical protein